MTEAEFIQFAENRISGKEWHNTIDSGYSLFKSKKEKL